MPRRTRVPGHLKPTTDGKAFALHDVDLRIQDPDLKIRGLVSLATAPPTTADALPTFDNWLAAIEPMALRTFDSSDSYASPFRIDIPSLRFERVDALTDPVNPTRASLRDWSFKYVANVPDASSTTPPPATPSVYERQFQGQGRGTTPRSSGPRNRWRCAGSAVRR